MALGTREMLLVIRARDEASRVLGRLSSQLQGLDRGAQAAAADAMARGGALVTLGAGIAAIGGAGVAFFADTVEGAAEYEDAARRALTQADGVKASLEDMKRIGRDVARDVPAAFDQMQEGLWTIFSTIDTDLPGAERLLREFARASVAGGTDVQTATEGGLQAMNAFGLGVEGVTRVNDVMFQLVRKGVGTFAEFVNSIGKAAPSAKRAGQDVESLAGMLAFMTRNGLSANMAATSAARAFDLMSNQKVVDRMEKMGVKTRNAAGEFLPMNEIVTQLGEKMKDLTAPERAEALAALFKGSGNNIQARRFFDLAIPGFQQLNDLTGSMRNSAGAMGEAYDIMFESPQAKVQALNNQYQIMRTEIGDRLLPAKLHLMEALSKLLDWWEKLSPTMQKYIVYAAAIASALAVLIGVVTIIAGAFLMFVGAIQLAGFTLAGVALTIGIVVAAIIAIGVAVFFIIKYWDEIKAATIDAWNWVRDTVVNAWNDLFEFFRGPVSATVDWIKDRWDTLTDFFHELWERMIGPLKNGWAELSKTFSEGMETVREKLQVFIDRMKDIWKSLDPVTSTVGDVLKLAWELIGHTFDRIRETIEAFKPVWDAFWKMFLVGVENVWKMIQTFFRAGLSFLIGVFNGMIDALRSLWKGFTNVFGGLLEFISSSMSFFVHLFTGQWGKLWDDLVGMITGAGNMIKGALQILAAPFIWLWGVVGGILNALLEVVIGFIRVFLNAFEPVGKFLWELVKWFFEAFMQIVTHIATIPAIMLRMGGEIIQGMWDGVSSTWNNFWSWLTGVFTSIINWVKNLFGIHSPSTVFIDIGIQIMQGLWNGLNWVIGSVIDFFAGLFGRVIGAIGNAGSWLWQKGWDIIQGAMNGIHDAEVKIWDFMRSIPGKALDAIGNVGSTLKSVGSKLIGGLIDGITSKFGDVKDTLGNLTGKLVSWKGPPKRDAVLLSGNGQLVMQSFVDGLESRFNDVHSSLQGMTNQLGSSAMTSFADGLASSTVTAAVAAMSAAEAVNDAFNSTIGLDDASFNAYAAGQINSGPTAASAAEDTTGGAGSSAGANVKVDIHTQEINPLQHATELGMIIAAQVA